VGTATVAMILNGLGFSNRRLYLVSQFFANKPVEHLLGPGITADMLHDDCLGRTLDWLYAHDPTALFAGIARQARQRFGVAARQVHVDTTSFAVSGEYAADEDEHTLAVTYGYSRDHRADLKQWILALATTRAGDVPLFCQALDGNASDKVTLVAAVEALADQLRTADETEAAAPIFVADSGLYSVENVARLSAAGVRWISRVPDTSSAARTALTVADSAWQQVGEVTWAAAGQAPEGQRWVVVRTTVGEARARATLSRQSRGRTPEVGEGAVASKQPALCLRPRRPGRAGAAAQAPAGVASRAEPAHCPSQADPSRTPSRGRRARADHLADGGDRHGG
jgi:transposase